MDNMGLTNQKLRFASYNVFHGGRTENDMSKIARNITKNKIDVVGLQEIDRGTQRSGGRDILKELSDATGYPYYAFFKTIDFRGGEYGIAILSRYPIIATEQRLLESGISEQRTIGFSRIDVNGLVVNFLVTHLTFDTPAIREAQLSEVSGILSQKGNFILSGDFNTSDLGALDDMQGVARINKRECPTVTFPEDEISIDNILYSTDKWRFGDINVVTESFSDHYMIWAEAEFIG